jgi:hypothetical protein
MIYTVLFLWKWIQSGNIHALPQIEKFVMTTVCDSRESNCVSDEYDKSGKNCILLIEDIYKTSFNGITRIWMVGAIKTKWLKIKISL